MKIPFDYKKSATVTVLQPKTITISWNNLGPFQVAEWGKGHKPATLELQPDHEAAGWIVKSFDQ